MRRPHRASRLFHRVYLHGVLLLVLLATALGVAGFFAGRDAPWRVRSTRLARHLAGELAPLPVPALPAEVSRLSRELDLALAVFSDDGRRLAAGGPWKLRPLPPDDLARLRSEPDRTLESHLVVSAAAGPGRHLRLSFHPRERDVIARTLGVLLVVVLVLAVASLPLARAIARPLEHLSRTARRLGAGDLSVRSGIDRRDEIGELARAFDETADRLQRLVEGQRELLANVSHELRTPIARIRVTLGLAAEAEPARGQAYLREIETDLGELDGLVGDVLTTARLDATGIGALRLSRVAPREVAELALQRFRRLHASRHVEASLGETPGIDGDTTLLGRVLDNLLDNAAKFSEGGTTIRLSLAAADGGIVFEVADRGTGIDPEDLDRVFTPFFRADRSRTRDTGGVGLGLALSKRIVEAHGGRIAVSSRVGEGTTVRAWLPAVAV